MPTDTQVRADLKPGLVYLTLGTAEQIQWLFQNETINLRVLWQPTTEEIILASQTGSALAALGNKPKDVLLIYPHTLEGTGSIKKRSSSKEGSRSVYLVPNDQFFRVHPSLYLFIICSDLLGEVDKKTKSGQVRKLEGGCFKVLDLQNLDYTGLEVERSVLSRHKMFPLTLKDKTRFGDILPCDDAEIQAPLERRLVLGLTTLEGVRRWGQFNGKDTYRYFLLESYNRVPLLNKARAWCLETYIQPFIAQLGRNTPLDNPSTILLEFAYWVYCSSKYWAESPSEGLRLYTPTRGKDPQPTFSFYISRKAKIEWLKLVSKMPYSSTLHRFRKC